MEIAKAVASAITEAGAVRDTASDAVKRTRARVATVEGRLRGMLTKHPTGEISTFRGRMCVSVALGTPPSALRTCAHMHACTCMHMPPAFRRLGPPNCWSSVTPMHPWPSQRISKFQSAFIESNDRVFCDVGACCVWRRVRSNTCMRAETRRRATQGRSCAAEVQQCMVTMHVVVL